MDRSWMYDGVNVDKHGLKDEFIRGVLEFVARAMERPNYLSEGGIRCPCEQCKCMNLATPAEVRWHLYRFGFQPNYWIWTEHREGKPNIDTRGDSNSSGFVHHGNQLDAMNQMVHDALRPYGDFPHVNANIGNETLMEDLPNTDAQQFYDKLISANQPIYEGAIVSKLSISVELLAVRSNYRVPQKGIDCVARMLNDVCPIKGYLPMNYYQATQLVSKLGLEAKKIDCCVNGCMLYYKEDSKLSECKFCGSARYLPRRIGMGRYKDVPAKRMFYFPIIPRLQRLYASTESAVEMRWHHDNRKRSDVLRHPSDGKAWKHFDDVYPDFASDLRNVRLGLCSDGFTPYVQASSTPYSCWPVIVTPYNLPPEKCMTKPYMFLTCLIPGSKNPKAKIAVYLQPLIDDLQRLWSNDVLTYDISTKQNFIMRACLMWTINDFPAYGMLSGWGTQVKLACPYCMEDTKAFTLKYGGKNSWFDCHRRFLPADHTFRRSKRAFTRNKAEKDGPPYIYTGQDVWEVVSSFPKVTEIGWSEDDKLPGYGVTHNWTKRSIFWDLPYWKDNLLRHNLDVMHLEKNFFDNVFNTVMNVTGKTKDNEKARRDLSVFCARADLELQALPNGKMGNPKARYALTSSDAKLVCKWVKELKMPDAYASNLARCADVQKGTMYGMKSHDCHVFMECLLPIAFRSLPDFVWRPLAELSRFFKDLCCNTLRMEDLVKLNENIPIIICKLEMIFPPGFFNSMEHLPIHLPYEAMLGGPVQYRWMYPFERLMGVSKRAVTNKARVEGSICADYIHRETTYFCSHYFKSFSLLPNTCLRNNPHFGHEGMQPTFSILYKSGRSSGKSEEHWLTDQEWKSAHVHVLINCDEIKPYLDLFLEYHSINEENASGRIHAEFPIWLKAYVHDEANGVTNKDIRALSWGPASKATSWNMYFVNGYRFHTKAWSNGKKTVNCGVHVKGLTEGGEDDFYGIIQHIFQLEYHDLSDRITLFYCEWFDPTMNKGTKVHPQYGIVDIKMNRRYPRYDPFILAQKARQVYYVPYPDLCRDMRGWCTAITTKPKGHVEIDDTENEIPYQSDQMSPVLPIAEIELIHGLGDNTQVYAYKEIFDHNTDPMDQDGQSVGEEEGEGEGGREGEDEEEDEDEDTYVDDDGDNVDE